MARGKATQEPRDCEYCNQPMRLLRHPKARFCSIICRERNRWQRDHVGSNGIKCLDCGKSFVKIGAHVIQAHGYETAREYRLTHGLDYKRGIVTEEHRAKLEKNVRTNGTINNLKSGTAYQFKKGDGRASVIVKKYHKYKRTGIYQDE